MISEEVKTKIKDDHLVRAKIGIELGVHERTILNWVVNDSTRLEAPAVIEAIKKHISHE